MLNNMPISRFLEWLEASGNLEDYMDRLVNAFNPGAVEGLMCRNTLSVGWDGRLYDCDFNQMLDLEVSLPQGPHQRIRRGRLAATLDRHGAPPLRLHRGCREFLRWPDRVTDASRHGEYRHKDTNNRFPALRTSDPGR